MERPSCTPDGIHRVSVARRLIDVLVAGVALLFATPLLALAAVAILVSSGRPLLFRAERVGEGGTRLGLYKLRTMRVGSAGPGVTAADDDRITRVGKILRRLSIDELPQLWCVLRGQMTLVGPRPESVQLAARYPAECRPVLMVRPGLTGPAQLRYRERSAVPPPGWDVETWYLAMLVPLRVQADREYLENPTVARTLRYLVLTALFVLGVVDLSEVSVEAPVPPTDKGSHRAFRH